MNTPSGTFGRAVAHLARPQRLAPPRALAALAATLRAWRGRARGRAELLAMDAHERRGQPCVRDFDFGGEMAKPFWCAYFVYGTGRRS